MTVWELRCGDIDNYSMIVPVGADAAKFDAEGAPLDWPSRPIISYADSRSQKRKLPPRPVADVAEIGGAAFVLSRRAFEVLGPFLGQFGQLLEVQTFGGAEFRYFYNVTNIVKCVDIEASGKSDFGAVVDEVFYDINVPRSPAVFKDPSTAKIRMYTNDAGRELLERLAREHGLTGLECGAPTKLY